jgi:hypothetical protein
MKSVNTELGSLGFSPILFNLINDEVANRDGRGAKG